MKLHKIVFIFFVLLVNLSTYQKAEAQGIEFFHGTWQEAIEEAQKTEKLIFVDAYTTWCGPCKRMSSQVFTQDKAGALFNSNFINLKVDMEKPNGREFGAKYPVSAYPTLFFLDPKGEILKKVVGGQQLEGLLSIGNEMVGKYDFSAKYREAYEAGDRSFDNVINYIEGLNKSGKSSLKIANDYLIENPNLTEEQMHIFLFKAASETDSRIFEQMMEQKSKLVSTFGQVAFDEKIIMSAQNTISKAIEYKDVNLMKSALKVLKANKIEEYKLIESKSNLEWAYAEKDDKKAISASKSYLKNVKETKHKISWANKMQETFPNNEKINKIVLANIEKDLAVSEDTGNISMYIKLLLNLNKKAEAIDYLKKADLRITDEKTKGFLSGLLRYAENYNS